MLRILEAGVACSIQDAGRRGWKRFGVPQSGWMDGHAARWANRLVMNDEAAPVLELGWSGARFEVLEPVMVAFCGAEVEGNLPMWQTHEISAGEIIHLKRCRDGVWSYLAIAGGFAVEPELGSASYYARARLGQRLEPGSILRAFPAENAWKRSVGRRWTDPVEIRHYADPPPLRFWPGPQWDLFEPATIDQLLDSEWTVDVESDRVGYRLQGTALEANAAELISEPMVIGSIQVPPNGQPIVVMRDGPCVGGYPKVGVVEPDSLDWLAQARPGQKLRFELGDGFEL